VQRNLGLAYVNKQGNLDRGLAAYEAAFDLNPDDARVFFELDQLYKKRNEAPSQRLERLERYHDLVEQRDDLTIERITLFNLLGRYEEALHILQTRHFHPWEGGEGKVTQQYTLSLVELAKQRLAGRDAVSALELLSQALSYPHNLGEGKLPGAQENNIHYYLGCTVEMLHQPENARIGFTRAARGPSEPTSPLYYNDQPPDMIFYQGRARQKLGQHAEAEAIFRRLVEYGAAHLDDVVTIDYFAVSLPDFLVFDEDLSQRNRVHCHYMQALGYLGLELIEEAAIHFQQVLTLNAYHTGAAIHRSLLGKIQL
jgi:tetratricopeptide (TPR) repeat protein